MKKIKLFNPHVFIFLMWTIFKVLIGFVTTLFLFCVLVLGLEICGISAPQSGIKPGPPCTGRQSPNH